MLETLKRVAVASYSEMPFRTGVAVVIGDVRIALFKLTNGEVRAIENRSPHPKGGVLTEGLVSGEYIFCPVYDWKISLRDGLVQAPDNGQVKTYGVKVEDDKVYVLIED